VRISVELVPRGETSLLSELELIRARLPRVDTINIPDVLRFPLRSWQGCEVARRYYASAIPHLRAIDIDLDRPLPMAELLRQGGISEVLVVTGDAPADMSRVVYPSSSTDVIKKVKRELPGMTVYAALDPYRQSFRAERDYALRKLEVGADGLFTQPFFDLRLMVVWAELLPDAPVFWGFTSVTTQRSLSYWKTRNGAVFPADFEPSLAWNRALAARALRFAEERNAHLYFMPIRTGVLDYLEGVL
jgi:methylenetetrahydrofolate reductase (NADPH)